MKNRLKEWRKKRGYTQQQFADIVGMSRNAILCIENGKNEFTDKNKEKFAKVLNCKPEDFLFLDNNVIPTGLISVPIKGYVQAGQFGEANELSLGENDVILYASPKFNNAHGLMQARNLIMLMALL